MDSKENISLMGLILKINIRIIGIGPPPYISTFKKKPKIKGGAPF